MLKVLVRSMLAAVALLVAFVAGTLSADSLNRHLNPQRIGSHLECISDRVCVGMSARLALSSSNVPGGLTEVQCGTGPRWPGDLKGRLDIGDLIMNGCKDSTFTATFSDEVTWTSITVADGKVVDLNRHLWTHG